MGVRENKVEKYLREQMQKFGGDTRKWVSPGRDGVPDQIVFGLSAPLFVEVKTTDGKLSQCQIREHGRLRGLGAIVTTVWGHRGVDALILDILERGPIAEEYHGV